MNMDKESIKKSILEVIADILGLSTDEISCTRKLQDYGMDSIIGVEMVGKINQIYDVNLHKSAVYTYPTVNQLVDYIESFYKGKQMDFYSEEQDFRDNILVKYQNENKNEEIHEEKKASRQLEKEKIEAMVQKLSSQVGEIPKEVYENCGSLDELAQCIADFLNSKEDDSKKKL